MRKPHTFDLEIFEHSYTFCLGWRPADFIRWFRKTYDRDMTEFLDEAEGLCIRVPKHNLIVIWTAKKSDVILIHECLHATNMTLSDIGHEAALSNDEVQAYLLSLLFMKAKGSRRQK